MKLFLLGDFGSNNGPSNANKEIQNALKLNFEVKCSHASNKISRVFEMISGIMWADMLIICSESKLNYLAIKFSRRKKTQIIYIMHGYSIYEEIINNPLISKAEMEAKEKYVQYIFRYSDKVVCVSKNFMEFMIQNQPQYKRKFEYIYNVVDIDILKSFSRKIRIIKNKRTILSTGGGIKRKNNIKVAEAIQNLLPEITYTIVGDMSEDGEKIKDMSNIKWIDYMEREDLFRLMSETEIYIQNSLFETFGLAVTEALFAGCSLLISEHVGCKDLFTTLSEDDVIYNVNDKNEIRDKILKVMKFPNNERLMKGFKIEEISIYNQAEKFKKIMQRIID